MARARNILIGRNEQKGTQKNLNSCLNMTGAVKHLTTQAVGPVVVHRMHALCIIFIKTIKACIKRALTLQNSEATSYRRVNDNVH